uniref:transposase n=1 Tax=Orientia tsutsugamushi TaxID=784 RepID=UPI001E635BD6|nr:transposase [Orientia tsutsugamushi]
MSLAELLTIAIYFYVSSCKDCKNYYLYYLSYKYKGYFCLPSYSRIIQLWPRMLLPFISRINALSERRRDWYILHRFYRVSNLS